MWLENALLTLIALLGHGLLWVFVFNHLHARPFPCRLLNALEKIIFAILATPPLYVAFRLVTGSLPLPLEQWQTERNWLFTYVGLTWLSAALFAAVWLWRKITDRRPAQFLSNDTRCIDIGSRLGYPLALDRPTRLLARIPGNQIFTLQVHEKTLALPRLPEALDGLSIVQISDLHFAGQIQQAYFHQVVAEANALDGDLIAITGDIADKTEYVRWIPAILGRLKSREGGYFILGNHDKRVKDIAALRRTLGEQGFMDLGGRCVKAAIRGEPVVLAGNECPWFEAPPDDACPPAEANGPLRILLSHSPDQIAWARRHRFDLMLAGHTHGGQIRIPLVGPIFCPSRYGVRYAAGVFYQAPTLLHVSRGIAALQAIRLNCPPELTKLVLVRAK